jgi:glycosyltransferase involved in cell wall biosynthesis/ubiquinone/menaquinone biosynthesis C-methylase UbiE
MDCIYVSTALGGSGRIECALPAAGVDRARMSIGRPELHGTPDLGAEVAACGARALIIEMVQGWPGRMHIDLARTGLRAGLDVWFYWPIEGAIESIDDERISSYRRQWLFIKLARSGRSARERAERYAARYLPTRLRRPLKGVWMSAQRIQARLLSPSPAQVPSVPVEPAFSLVLRDQGSLLDSLIRRSAPVALGEPVAGRTAMYLRTDYWAPIFTGGSYGHTCYVAKELAATGAALTCVMANRFVLLDEMGLEQVLIPTPSPTCDEQSLIRANGPCFDFVAAQAERVRPSFIYERLCLGNFVGARLSREFGIPYFVEYNGSEISMRKSFDSGGFEHEEFFLKAEEAAFRQATVISVISDAVREDLLNRGIPAHRILVNPNGVDTDAYAPPLPATRRLLRAQLGFAEDDRVVGFIGTFGGWHGIDVLSEALPLICTRNPHIRFLLIGDGNFKHLVDDAVRQHRLEDRVICTGRVAHGRGAELLGACDIFVSPHSRHMVDSRFFGSPTKLFEYMAVGSGIVASDLEQIGEVLSPALRPPDFRQDGAVEARAILCKPGSTPEFVDAVVFLADDPSVCDRLGQSARRAAISDFSWRSHVDRLMAFARAAAGTPPGDLASGRIEGAGATPGRQPAGSASAVQTGDEYKDEVQRQWDNNPCGSHYAAGVPAHTYEWFLEVERYRYVEYAPWMPETMEFASHAGERVLEIGAGLGTDLAQFAKNGAIVTDVDLSSGHLNLAQENFRHRGLRGTFVHHDAENLPFADGSFDVVYSNGVIHHTPDTAQVVREINRVLRPGGKAIIMVYAENSLHYWRNLVSAIGLRQNMIDSFSVSEIMSRHVEITENDARPLVKVYTRRRLSQLFSGFRDVSIVQRQMVAAEVPSLLGAISLPRMGQLMGWNLIVKAYKR